MSDDLLATFRRHCRAAAALRLLTRIRQQDRELWLQIQQFARQGREGEIDATASHGGDSSSTLVAPPKLSEHEETQ